MSETERKGADLAGEDLYQRILSALTEMGKPLDSLTVEDLAPVDHFHARGLAGTVELADKLPIKASDHLLDIGCGLGGPARYFADRFGCHVTGVDISETFVDVANRLTALLGVEGQVEVELGDALDLPSPDESFNGAIAQHATMNLPDRTLFFDGVLRVLKPGGFLALSEHGLGPAGNPVYPAPWSEDGSNSFLVPPAETRDLLQAAGFVDFSFEDMRPKYLSFYQQVLGLATQGMLQPLGPQLIMGESSLTNLRDMASNIEEGRIQPVVIIARKAA